MWETPIYKDRWIRVPKRPIDSSKENSTTAVLRLIGFNGSEIRIAEALQVSTDTLLRPDIPQVNHLYQAEFEELLGDCSPDEIESILKIVKEVKVATRRRKTEYDL